MFNVIYADPPWAFRNKKTGGSHTSGSAQHYAVLPTAQIRDVSLARIRDQDAVLYLWVPSSMLEDGLSVLKAWGFTYKTLLVWRKVRSGGKLGIGYWYRNALEVLLFGVRGSVKAFRSKVENHLNASVLPHSSKPVEVYRMIEEATAGMLEPRYLELFAREHPSNWVGVGLEADGTDLTDPEWFRHLRETPRESVEGISPRPAQQALEAGGESGEQS
jgi:N6-adenosine-specific RNA methylase IME4